MLLFSTWLNNSIFVSGWGKERVWTVVLTESTTVQVFLYFKNRRPYSEPCLHWASFDRQNICSALNPEWEFLLQEHLLLIQKVYLYSEWEPFTSERVTMSLTFYRKQNPGAIVFFFPSLFTLNMKQIQTGQGDYFIQICPNAGFISVLISALQLLSSLS